MLPDTNSRMNAARKLARDELEIAKQHMEVSIFGLEHSQLSIANHWSFHSINAAMRACLLSELKTGLHRDELFQTFKSDFIRSGIFSLDMEPKLAYVMELHMGLDEEDYYLCTIEQMHTAMDLIRMAEDYLNP